MAPLSGGDLLDLWERAEGTEPPRRALVLAAAADRSTAPEALAELPVGEVDARLLALRRQIAGSELGATATCPTCDEAVEFSIDIDALLAVRPGPVDEHVTEVDGVVITWRCPTGADLAHVATFDDLGTAESVLLERCIVGSVGAGSVGPGPVGSQDLTDRVRAAVVAAMAEADPLAEVLADLTCPACDTSFTADVDVATFAWIEVRAAAHRLLREIDALARAYGWTEPEVLELSDARRAAYLEMALESA